MTSAHTDARDRARQAWISALNDYSAIYHGEPGLYSPQLRSIAAALHRVDRPGRRRRYLATSDAPTIDGYLDFIYAEQAAARSLTK
jgi:hypothetical protein